MLNNRILEIENKPNEKLITIDLDLKNKVKVLQGQIDTSK